MRDKQKLIVTAYETGMLWMFNTLIDAETNDDETWNTRMNVVEFNQALVNANDPATPAFETEEEVNAFYEGAYSEYCAYFGMNS